MLINADWCSNKVQPGFLLLERTSGASPVIFSSVMSSLCSCVPALSQTHLFLFFTQPTCQCQSILSRSLQHDHWSMQLTQQHERNNYRMTHCTHVPGRPCFGDDDCDDNATDVKRAQGQPTFTLPGTRSFSHYPTLPEIRKVLTSSGPSFSKGLLPPQAVHLSISSTHPTAESVLSHFTIYLLIDHNRISTLGYSPKSKYFSSSYNCLFKFSMTAAIFLAGSKSLSMPMWLTPGSSIWWTSSRCCFAHLHIQSLKRWASKAGLQSNFGQGLCLINIATFCKSNDKYNISWVINILAVRNFSTWCIPISSAGSLCRPHLLWL